MKFKKEQVRQAYLKKLMGEYKKYSTPKMADGGIPDGKTMPDWQKVYDTAYGRIKQDQELPLDLDPKSLQITKPIDWPNYVQPLDIQEEDMLAKITPPTLEPSLNIQSTTQVDTGLNETSNIPNITTDKPEKKSPLEELLEQRKAGRKDFEQIYNDAVAKRDEELKSAKIGDTITNSLAALSKIFGNDTGIQSNTAKDVKSNLDLINEIQKKEQLGDTFEEDVALAKLAEDKEYKKQYLDYLNKKLSTSESDRKKAEEDSKIAIMGFKHVGKNKPTPKRVMELTDGLSLVEQLKDDIQKYKDMMAKYGTYEFIPGEFSAHQSVMMDKVRKAAELGVLNKEDIPVIEAKIPNPTNLKALVRNKEDVNKILDSTFDNYKNTALINLKRYGYEIEPEFEDSIADTKDQESDQSFDQAQEEVISDVMNEYGLDRKKAIKRALEDNLLD